MRQDAASQNFIYGLHAVMAVLEHQPERAKKLFIARAEDATAIKSLAHRAGIPHEQIDRQNLEKRFKVGSEAQGLVLLCSAFPYVDLNDALKSSPSRILVLDSWQDPANIGRAARGALSFGASLMVMCKDRSASINASAEKSAVGALAQVSVARVTNLAAAIKKIKDAGIFVYGADERGDVTIKRCDFASRAAIVVGQEGAGLRELTKKSCDVLVNIPMSVQDICLNAADTALIFLYELSTR